MSNLRRYTFKLYPNKAQDAALRENARMCASLWNALLEMRETFYRRAVQRGDKKTSLTAFDQGKDITALRAELPEWRDQPRGTQERVAEMLDLAFKAFFRRAREGAGASSGYPRFKSVVRADSVHLREPAKSCWSFSPSQAAGTADPQPARKGEPNGDAQGSPRARGEGGSSGDSFEAMNLSPSARGEGGASRVCCRTRPSSSRARGEGEPGQHVQFASPRARREGGGKANSYRLRIRGIPGVIKARGKFPVEPEAFKTADIRFYDGAWWFSVCVAMPTRREIGARDLRIELDLIDKFASVTDANGEHLAGLSDPFGDRKGEPNGSDKEPRARAGDGCQVEGPSSPGPRARAGDGLARWGLSPAMAEPRTRAGDGMIVARSPRAEPRGRAGDGVQVQTLQSARDRRFRRFSLRWRREKARIARLQAREARRRRETLHRWSTAIARIARAIEITAPPKRALRTGRGDAAKPGAEVATIAMLNRHVLAQAPAAAIQMLEYKMAEAGGACAIIRREDHEIGVGRDLRAAAITNRRAKRAVKQKEKHNV